MPYLFLVESGVDKVEALSSVVGTDVSVQELIDQKDQHTWEASFGSNFAKNLKDTEVLWLRVPVVNQSDDSESRYLKILYPYLSRIDFYLVMQGHAIRSDSGGMDIDRDVVEPQFQYNLPAKSEGYVYLKVRSKGLALFPMINLRADQLDRWQTLSDTVMGVIFGALAALVIYNLFLFASLKEKVYVYYVGHLSTSIITHGFYLGFFGTLDQDITNEIFLMGNIVMSFILVNTVFVVYFFVSFLRLDEHVTWFYKGLRVYSWAMIVSFPYTLLGPKKMAVIIGLGFLGIGLVICAAGFVSLLGRARVNAYFVVGWVGFIVFDSQVLMGILGFYPDNPLIFKFSILGIIWEGFFLSFALADRINVLKKERSDVQAVLTGMLPQTKLNEIFNKPADMKFDMVSKKASVMFVDIVGFSILSKSYESAEFFGHLSTFLSQITKIINKHGGNVDRSLGDGIFCYFTEHSIQGNTKNHELRAFEAAVEIQEFTVASVRDGQEGTLLFPLRIGINSSNVYLGNVGGKGRIDYTLIGDGVNFTSRLEGACNPFCIMLSESSFEGLPPSVLERFSPREIFLVIKHESNFQRAFECDVFANQRELKIKADMQRFAQLKIEKKTSRVETSEMVSLTLVSDQAEFEVRDFSINGFGVVSDTFFAVGVKLEVLLVAQDEWVSQSLEKKNLNKFSVEVKWSRVSDDQYKHGFQFLGLHKDHRQQLFEELLAGSDTPQDSLKIPS